MKAISERSARRHGIHYQPLDWLDESGTSEEPVSLLSHVCEALTVIRPTVLCARQPGSDLPILPCERQTPDPYFDPKPISRPWARKACAYVGLVVVAGAGLAQLPPLAADVLIVPVLGILYVAVEMFFSRND